MFSQHTIPQYLDSSKGVVSVIKDYPNIFVAAGLIYIFSVQVFAESLAINCSFFVCLSLNPFMCESAQASCLSGSFC